MNPMAHALNEARDALNAARDRNYSGLLMTGEEVRQCDAAIESIDAALAHDEEAEADAQRARDICIGANGYDLSRLGTNAT